MQRRNLATVDALRALSAQAVLLGHYHALLSAPPKNPGSWVGNMLWRMIDLVSVYSHQAVIVFFVLSGYLVGSRVLHDVRQQKFHYGDYLLRRFARLYSVIVPGLALTWLVMKVTFDFGHGLEFIQQNRPWYPTWFDSAHSNALSTLFCNLAGLQMIACYQYGHNLALWSLSNEWLYYLAFPSLLLATTVGRLALRLRHLAVVACVVLLVAGASTPRDPDRALIYINGFLVWSAGAVVPQLQSKLVRLKIITRGVLLAALLVPSVVIFQAASSIHVQDFAMAGLTLCILLTATALPMRWPLCARFLSSLAGYSYSLYFIHLPLLIAVAMVTWPDIKIERSAVGAVLFVGACLAANLAAWLFWLTFECRYRDLYRWARRMLRLERAA